MDDKIEKLIEHKIKTGMSEEALSKELGITRKTFYRLKKGTTNAQEYTRNQVDKFIDTNNL
jgi:DNA-binding XRE family transcriptional regulator